MITSEFIDQHYAFLRKATIGELRHYLNMDKAWRKISASSMIDIMYNIGGSKNHVMALITYVFVTLRHAQDFNYFFMPVAKHLSDLAAYAETSDMVSLRLRMMLCNQQVGLVNLKQQTDKNCCTAYQRYLTGYYSGWVDLAQGVAGFSVSVFINTCINFSATEVLRESFGNPFKENYE